VSSLAGGTNFSAAVRADGAIVAWGLNSSGQLGDTTTTQRTTPTLAVGPTGMALVATGASHTVAVGTDGAIWTWGAGGSGRLGDGATANRATPLTVLASGGSWGTPAPLLSLAPGLYREPQSVSLWAATGTTVRYTMTGVAPTETDPIWATGTSLPLTGPVTVMARAWQPGLAPSPVVTAAYAFQPLPPTATPAAGTYGTAQSVTLQAASGTTIRYTLDGTTPTASAPVYSAPIPVAAPATVTARAFRSGWSDSDSLVSAYAFVLPPPVATPASGALSATQPVTLTATPGATIHYTLDGSTPTAASPAYAGPFTIASAVTVKALATLAGWEPSPVATASYVSDTEGPTITAAYTPAPSVAGWHNTPVTVSFTCADALSAVTSCPPPVLFDQEGANQSVTVSATDAVGNMRSTTITVQIDLTPPEVTGTAPTDGTTITVSSITVAATVADILSGVASVFCNGVSAAVTGNTVDCIVPASPGQNSVTVAVQDAAGNSSSWAVRVLRDGTPTQLTVAPANRTLTVGEAFAFTVASEFAPVTTNVVWTSSDPTILSVASDGSGVVTSETPGTVTLTATVGGLSAPATVTVQGLALAPGAIRWTAPGAAPAGLWAAWPIPTVRQADGDPDLFAVEADTPDGPYTIRSLTAEGQQRAVEHTELRPAFGDQYGALLAIGPGQVARVTGSAAQPPWRYVAPLSAGSTSTTVEGLTQAPDGTVFVVERRATTPVSPTDPNAGYHSESSVVGLIGTTGVTRFRAPLAPSSWDLQPTGCEARPDLNPQHTRHAAGTRGIVVGTDGAAYLPVEEWHDVWSPRCVAVPHMNEFGEVFYTTEWDPGAGTVSFSAGLRLVRISPTGSLISTPVWNWQYAGPDTADVFAPGFHEYAAPFATLPDGLGGVLLAWDHLDGEAQATHLTRVVDGVVTADRIGPGLVTLVGEATVYVQDGATVRALTLESLNEKWAAVGEPLMALGQDGLALRTPIGTVAAHDANGVPGAGFQTPLAQVASVYRYGEWLGQDVAAKRIANTAGIGVAPGQFEVQRTQDVAQGGNRRSHLTADRAAREALDYAFSRTWRRNVEYGGHLCQHGPASFSWTGPVTDDHPTDVDTENRIELVCRIGSRMGNYHAHGPSGQAFPSGTTVLSAPPSDIHKADGRPWITFYAMTRPLLPGVGLPPLCPMIPPDPDRRCFATDSAAAPPRSLYRYQQPSTGGSARDNVWIKLPDADGDPLQNGGWIPFPVQPQ